MLESPVNKYFEKVLSLIKDQGKRSKVAEILRTISVENFQKSASSSNKYHPKFAQGDRGLGRHTKAVISFSADMCTAFPELDYDSMIISALMHDLKKYKEGAGHTNKEHAETIADLLESKGLSDEARMTRSHMGQWGKTSPSQFDEKMLHLADYLASRTYISIDWDENDNIIEENSDARRLVNKFDDLLNQNARHKYEQDFLEGKNEGF